MRKKRILLMILIICISFLMSACSGSSDGPVNSPTQPAEKDYRELVFEIDGMKREGILYVPEDLPDNSPLVIVLHGYTGTSKEIMEKTGMNDLADEHGFAVCYPQGMPAETGSTHWNAWLGISEVDDISFIGALVRYLQAEYKLDPDRTFACGFSNGGFMSYGLAVANPDMFRAIASVSGSMSSTLWKNREMAEPVSVLHIHGTADNSVPLAGTVDGNGDWSGTPPINSVINFWVEVNSCQSHKVVGYPPDTTAWIYSSGAGGNEVWYYEIKDWPHAWPGFSVSASGLQKSAGISASEKIWEFFSNFR